MEKDILAHMEALTTQAKDTDSAAAYKGAPPAIQTVLEDANLDASSGGNVGQESMGPREGDEVEKMSNLSLCQDMEAEAPRPQAAPDHAIGQRANIRGCTGKKNSRKRRNRKERKMVYLPCPLTLRTRASSAAPVLGHAPVLGPLLEDVSVEGETWEQRENGEGKKASILSQSRMALAGALLPAASPTQSYAEWNSLVDNQEIKVGQENSHKGRNKKKIMCSPWPLTVQAWASYTDPGPLPTAPLPTAPAGASAVADDGVNTGLRSRDRKEEKDKMSLVTSYQSAQAGSPCSDVASRHGPLEEVSFAKDGLNVGEKSGCTKRDRKDQSVLSPSRPLTVQAGTSFRAKDGVQTLLQGESSMASVRMNMGQKGWPQVGNGKEEAKSILPCPVRVQADASFAAKALGQDSFEGTSALEDRFSRLSQSKRGPQQGEESQVQSST
ncbi:uncharacterized protein LOC112582222 [Bubalus bubalis]|uniref:uncharacterized protein LOC112582222 n=1 Tax=Bubalus bubalis TaxID=89462 RepID=UPI001D11B9E1|nr:uncharacterized protein LOC112582222 [Bubalus bubalis]